MKAEGVTQEEIKNIQIKSEGNLLLLIFRDQQNY